MEGVRSPSMDGTMKLTILDYVAIEQEMERHGALSTTTSDRQNLKYFLHENTEERDFVHLLQEDGPITKSPRCLPWGAFTDCGKDLSDSFRKLLDSGRSKLKKKQHYIFVQINLFTAAITRHGAARSPRKADKIASIETAPKSIVYYA